LSNLLIVVEPAVAVRQSSYGEWNFGTSFAQIASPGKQPTQGAPG